MTIDLTKPITTRDGQPVTILKTNLKTTTNYTILGYATAKDGTHTVCVWDPQGRVSFGRETNNDLINKPKVIKGWVNVYPMFSNASRVLVLHPTREIADDQSNEDRVACIYVEWQEGTGL